MNVPPPRSCAQLGLLIATLFVAGCSSGVEDLVAVPDADRADNRVPNAPQSPPPPPPPPPAMQSDPEATPGDLAGEQSGLPVEPVIVPPREILPEPQAAKPQTTMATVKPQAAAIRLSAGVALPQTLPTGTAMGFSVDYEFTEGRPSPASPYVLVIEPAKGPAARINVRLKTKGTLEGFIVGWRPEHGPFEGHLEDARGNWLSGSLPLR